MHAGFICSVILSLLLYMLEILHHNSSLKKPFLTSFSLVVNMGPNPETNSWLACGEVEGARESCRRYSLRRGKGLTLFRVRGFSSLNPPTSRELGYKST